MAHDDRLKELNLSIRQQMIHLQCQLNNVITCFNSLADGIDAMTDYHNASANASVPELMECIDLRDQTTDNNVTLMSAGFGYGIQTSALEEQRVRHEQDVAGLVMAEALQHEFETERKQEEDANQAMIQALTDEYEMERMRQEEQGQATAVRLALEMERANTNTILQKELDEMASQATARALRNIISKEREQELSDMRYRCEICLNDEVELEAMYTITGCSHRFCTLCLYNHVKTFVQSHRSLDIRCPMPECTDGIDLCQLQELVQLDQSELTGEKQNFLAQYHEIGRELVMSTMHDQYRKCPNIIDGEACTSYGAIDLNNASKAICVFDRCGREFCVNCNQQPHRGTCRDYARRLAEAGDENALLFLQWCEETRTQKCPKCHTDVELVDGCNWIACTVCTDTYFCYQCGEAAGPAHAMRCGCPLFGRSL